MEKSSSNSVAILGTGESGMGAALLAHTKGLKVFVSDSKQINPENKELLMDNGIEFEESVHMLSRLVEFDEIVKSPGIPEKAPIIKDLRNADKTIISEIEFAARYTNAKLIGITGSNGKTTTTLLTYHLLKSAGLNVGVAGNIGNSLAALLADKDFEIIVLELSSFQLDGIEKFNPDTAMILNITPDHLDRYEYDIEKYANAKLRLTMNQSEDEILIHGLDDKLVMRKIQEHNVQASKLGFSLQEIDNYGAYFDGFELRFSTEKSKFSIPVGDVPLIGKHNLYNAMAAVLAATRFGLDKEEIVSGLSSFKNAPHRLEYVARVDGIRFINDSKATNVDSVYYALDGLDRDIIWIAGGVNKGNDYDAIRDLVKKKVNALICLGTDNQHLIDAFGSDLDMIIEVLSMDDAVNAALKMAYPGDVVLLSPACASFDLFDNYEHRGDLFKQAVMELKKNFKIKRPIAV